MSAVPNYLALTLLDDASLPDAYTTMVQSVERPYVLDKSNSLAVNGTTVIATRSGNGRFISTPFLYQLWLDVEQWWIDAVNGDDENIGTIQTAPLKSHAELERRWGPVGQTLSGVVSTLVLAIRRVVVNVLSDLPATDPIKFDIRLPSNTLLAYCGKFFPTLTGGTNTGTVGGYVPFNRATNTQVSFTDAGITWANHIGKRIRGTSGVSLNQIGWIKKDLGAGAVEISPTNNPSLPASAETPSAAAPPDRLAQTAVTVGVFANGDTFVIEDMTSATLGATSALSTFRGTGARPTIGFANFDLQGDPAPSAINIPQGVPNSIFKGCRLRVGVQCDNTQAITTFVNCGLDQGINCYNSAVQALGGLSRGLVTVRRGGLITLDFDHTVQGSRVQPVNGTINIGTACVNDAPVIAGGTTTGGGVVIGVGSVAPGGVGVVRIQTFGAGTHALWGANPTATVAGVDFATGSQFMTYVTNIPTITGAGGAGVTDFRFGTALLGQNIDQATGLISAKTIVTSWTNLAAAKPLGFGGYAHDYDLNCHLTKAV